MPETLTVGKAIEVVAKQEAFVKSIIEIRYRDSLARVLPELGDAERGLPTRENPQKELYMMPRVLAGQFAYRAGVLRGLGDLSITVEITLKNINDTTFIEVSRKRRGTYKQAKTLVEVTGIEAFVLKMFEKGVETGELTLAGIQAKYGVSADTPEK